MAQRPVHVPIPAGIPVPQPAAGDGPRGDGQQAQPLVAAAPAGAQPAPLAQAAVPPPGAALAQAGGAPPPGVAVGGVAGPDAIRLAQEMIQVIEMHYS